ncbi:MAG: hypothetical protein MJB14_15755 [Spirochaetes bacterium]|nr:hypothetical protein [Spirochaetota bacterium]
MQLKFDKIFYDCNNEIPIAVCIDSYSRPFFFQLSDKTAENILVYQKNKNMNMVHDFFVDLYRYSNARILKISILKSSYDGLEGVLKINIKHKVKQYQLKADELILLAVLFNRPLYVNPNVFFSSLEKINKKPEVSDYYYLSQDMYNQKYN